MELVNQTAAAAEIAVADNPDGTRAGRLLVKTTFEVAPGGHVTLVSEDPEPILLEDTPCELGLLPKDDTPVRAGLVEVLLLGRAYAPHGMATEAAEITLSVGDRHRSAYVIGDRRAELVDDKWHFGTPSAFETMPLVWERAAFEPAQLWLDKTTCIPYPLVDAAAASRGLRTAGAGAYFGAAPGFPRLDMPKRSPNLFSSAEAAKTGWVEYPECWAPCRLSDMSRLLEIRRALERGETIRLDEAQHSLVMRCHPAWVLPALPYGYSVRSVGLVSSGEWSFMLPGVSVCADYEVGSRGGSVQLAPFRLMLLPEQRRFYVVYGLSFATRVRPDDLRSVRVRLI